MNGKKKKLAKKFSFLSFDDDKEPDIIEALRTKYAKFFFEIHFL